MDLFNDMYIEKYRADGSEQLFRVPIQFANREKYLQQLQSRVHHGSDHDGSVNKSLFELDMILPRMSVNILALSYDVQRKVGKQNKIFACEPCSLNELNHPFTNTPAPWNLELELPKHKEALDKINYSQKIKDKYEEEYEQFDRMQKYLRGKSVVSFKQFIFKERESILFWNCWAGVGLQIDNPMDYSYIIYDGVKSQFGDNVRKGMAEKFKRECY